MLSKAISIRLTKSFFSNPLRLTTVVLLVLTVFLAIASYYWFFPVLKRVEDDIVRSQRVVAETSEDLLNVFFEFTFSELAEFGFQHYINPELHHQFHNAFLDTRKDFLSVIIINHDGIPASEAILLQGRVSAFDNLRSARGTAFFSKAIEDGIYISPVFFSINGPTLQLAKSINDREGTLLGVAVAEIDFSLIRDVVSRNAVKSGKVYVVDERGTIVSDSNESISASGENLRFRDIVNLLVGGQDNVELSRYVNADQQRVLAYGLRMKLTGWGIVVEQLESEALKQKNQTLLAAWVFASSGLLLVLLIFASSIRLVHAISNIERERKEKERVIEYLPDGVIEYTGENKILGINPAAREFLNIKNELPESGLYIFETAAPLKGFEKLWTVFFPRHELSSGGQGSAYFVKIGTKENNLKVITIYIKGVGPLWDQRYLKILHDVSEETK